MYYDNKQTFYVKQYGPTVIIGVVSLILISSGIFLYVKSTNMKNPFAKKTEVIQTVDTDNNAAEETNAIIKETKVEEPKTDVVVDKYFETLPALEKSKEVNVTNVSDTGNITVESDGDKLEITLIGVDFKYSNQSAIEKIKTDLLNKKVKIAFDNLRSENNKTYAYIFSEKLLYNAELLKTGLFTIKTERKNICLNTELANAQALARQNSLGVWKK
jgi:endonuclease YncB( thermonuclease family)